MRLICATLLVTLALPAQAASKKQWLFWGLSLGALAAGTAMDVHSSWGHQELNPLLRSPDGRFGHRGAAIRVGFVGGGALAQWLVIRKHPTTAPIFSGINTGLGAMFGGISVRNRRVAEENAAE